MKKLSLLICFLSVSIFAQVNTEIHVFDIKKEGENFKLENGVNISQNEGYDNQPSFYDDHTILYAHTRGGFTDILLYDLKTKSKRFISKTSNGGEYSPQRIPNSNNVSAVRLDKDGLQRFYEYDFSTGTDTEIFEKLKVAYPTWVDENSVVASVIVGEAMELFICDLKKKECVSMARNVGRSVKKIPRTNLVSFISKENKNNWILKSINPKTKEINAITTVGKTEDMAWMPDGSLLIPRDKRIYRSIPNKSTYRELFFGFTDENINNISRMSVSDDGTKIALVAEVSPRYLAQEQLDAYNKRDIEAFLKPYAKNVKVYTYPNTLTYEGIDLMRKRYELFFKNTPDLHCKLLKRIVHGNQVIDHELITINGRQVNAVAIYTMKYGKIASVTFL
ncbi:MAG: nuclear transport factor 2 family protein [Polaribacter sp.]